MKPKRFKESNYNLKGIKTIDGNVRPQIPIRISHNGQKISCWRASLLQRIAFLFHGKIWIGIQTNGKNMPPIWASCEPTVFSNKYITVKKNYVKSKKSNIKLRKV